MSIKIKYALITAVVVIMVALSGLLARGQIRGTAVAVTLKEWSIEMPQEIPEGPVTFSVTNKGMNAHNFEIKGNNVDRKFDNDLEPGQTSTMDIVLDAGTYTVFCPVGMHAGEGMKVTLTVTKKMQEKENP